MSDSKKEGLSSDLIRQGEEDEKTEQQNLFQSVFNPNSNFYMPSEPKFFPPDAFGSSNSLENEIDPAELEMIQGWEIATRYHEFKSRTLSAHLKKQLRQVSVEAVLAKAKDILGSLVHPSVFESAPWPQVPSYAHNVDFDLEETLDYSPTVFLQGSSRKKGHQNLAPSGEDIWMRYSYHRTQPVVLTVDTSLSMTGEKLALTAVALAVVLLEFREDPIGIVAFESEARVLKHPEETITLEALMARFLDVPAQGYTHLEDGMRASLKLLEEERGVGVSRLASTVLLTDGKYTAGKDPAFLADRFQHLIVLKMGDETSGLELCRDLAKRGRGRVEEVGELDALPSVMYGVVKDLLRGRPMA